MGDTVIPPVVVLSPGNVPISVTRKERSGLGLMEGLALPMVEEVGEEGVGEEVVTTPPKMAVSQSLDSLQQLDNFANHLMSPKKPLKRQRSVHFEESCLPQECNVDKVTSAVIYHSGQSLSLERARSKPGQNGYQIFTVKKDEKSQAAAAQLFVDADQPHKLVLKHQTGDSFVFTGAEEPEKRRASDESPAAHIVSLAPIKKEQLLRIRMDLLVTEDNGGSGGGRGRLTALLISKKKPSMHTLGRFYGLNEMRQQRAASSTIASFVVLFLRLFALIVLAFCLKELYIRYHFMANVALISSAKDVVSRSSTLTREFGTPTYNTGGVNSSSLLEPLLSGFFAYTLDLYSAERASFSMPFIVNGEGGDFVTKEWEIEGTTGEAGDEISVTFDGRFKWGEAAVEAYRVDDTWHFSSLKIDLYQEQPRYFAWGWLRMGEDGLERQEKPHLRINMEIGHDGDLDGDADHETSTIILEKSQLVCYLRGGGGVFFFAVFDSVREAFKFSCGLEFHDYLLQMLYEDAFKFFSFYSNLGVTESLCPNKTI